MEPPKLLVATANPGKILEFRDLLAGLPCRITGLNDEGISSEVAETGATFEDNARLKAEAYAAVAGLVTLADDSGLEVDALGGRPGVHSARYGGPGLSDEDRVQLLLRELAGVPGVRRTARFICVIALAAPAQETRLVRGECEGRIAFAPRGSNGFGYDPVFLLPDRGLTTAELPPAEKHEMSHRGAASRAARPLILSFLGSWHSPTGVWLQGSTPPGGL